MDVILYNGRISTMGDREQPTEVEAIGIRGGKIAVIGSTDEVRATATTDTKQLDLGGRRVIPGLIDNHIHFVRAGLTWGEELRWERVPDLTTALQTIRDDAARRPAGEWIRVSGGWNELQFPERRGPSIDELNLAAPNHPVYVQVGYSWARVNEAGKRLMRLDRQTVEQVGADWFELDADGEPTGEVRTMAGCSWLYARLPVPDQESSVGSTVRLSRDLNRFAVTSLTDGGGVNTGPDVYAPVYEADRRGHLSVRTFLTVHSSGRGKEAEEVDGYFRYLKPRHGSDMLQVLGLGEVLLYEFHDKLDVNPDYPEPAVEQLRGILRKAAAGGWPVQMHMHQPSTLDAFLGICEEINAERPLSELRWGVIHGEFMEHAHIDRIKRLGLGFLSQCLLRFVGAKVIDHIGLPQTRQSPPLRKIIDAGIPVSAGTDAMRGASFDPFSTMHFYLTGEMVGGVRVVDEENLLDREEALALFTRGSAWQVFGENRLGRLLPTYEADLAVLSDDYFSVGVDEIKALESEVTLVGGKPVYVSESAHRLWGLEEVARTAPALRGA